MLVHHRHHVRLRHVRLRHVRLRPRGRHDHRHGHDDDERGHRASAEQSCQK